MVNLYILAITPFLVSMALTQSIADLPSCAVRYRSFLDDPSTPHILVHELSLSQQSAGLSSISSTGCQITDVPCICKSQAWIASLTPTVKKDCDDADYQSTSPFQHRATSLDPQPCIVVGGREGYKVFTIALADPRSQKS